MAEGRTSHSHATHPEAGGVIFAPFNNPGIIESRRGMKPIKPVADGPASHIPLASEMGARSAVIAGLPAKIAAFNERATGRLRAFNQDSNGNETVRHDEATAGLFIDAVEDLVHLRPSREIWQTRPGAIDWVDHATVFNGINGQDIRVDVHYTKPPQGKGEGSQPYGVTITTGRRYPDGHVVEENLTVSDLSRMHGEKGGPPMYSHEYVEKRVAQPSHEPEPPANAPSVLLVDRDVVRDTKSGKYKSARNAQPGEHGLTVVTDRFTSHDVQPSMVQGLLQKLAQPVLGQAHAQSRAAQASLRIP